MRIAKGSAAEVETQLILCVDLEYLQPDEIKEAISLYNEIIRMLGALIVKIDKRIQEKK